MAEDTTPEIQPMDFHSCDTPRGMLYYHMDDLTSTQQEKLNELKVKTVREDEQYLAGHPEIRACVALITRHVLKKRPRNAVHDVIAQFFARSKIDIENEIRDYINQREGHNYEGSSAVGLYARSASRDSSFEDMSTFTDEQEKVSDSLKNIEINLNEVDHPPEGKMISSISEITDTGIYQSGELENIRKIINLQLMEDLIVSEMLSKIPYEEEEEDDEAKDWSPSMSARVSFSPALVTEAAIKEIAEIEEEYNRTQIEEDIRYIINTEIDKYVPPPKPEESVNPNDDTLAPDTLTKDDDVAQ